MKTFPGRVDYKRLQTVLLIYRYLPYKTREANPPGLHTINKKISTVLVGLTKFLNSAWIFLHSGPSSMFGSKTGKYFHCLGYKKILCVFTKVLPTLCVKMLVKIQNRQTFFSCIEPTYGRSGDSCLFANYIIPCWYLLKDFSSIKLCMGIFHMGPFRKHISESKTHELSELAIFTLA